MDTRLQQLMNDLMDHDKANEVLSQLAEMGAEAAPAAGPLGRLLVQRWYKEHYIIPITQILIKLGPAAAYLVQEMAKPASFISTTDIAYSCSAALIAIGSHPFILDKLLELLVDLYDEYDSLARSLTSDDLSTIKHAVITTLNGFGSGAAPLAPTLTNWLTGTRKETRYLATIILGSIGAPALPALHKIAGLFSGYSSDVKQAARETIRQIKVDL